MKLLSSAVFTLRTLLWIMLNVHIKGDHSCQELKLKGCDGNTETCYYEPDGPRQSAFIHEAEKICNCKMMKIVSPKDEGTTKFLQDHFAYDFWINLQRKSLETFTFINSEKEYQGDIEHADGENHLCAFVRVPNRNSKVRMLRAAPCLTKKKFVCRTDISRAGVELPFHTEEDPLSWYEARSKCISQLDDLAYPDQNQSIISLLESYDMERGEYWIGLHKEEWLWGDGSRMTYSNWDEERNQPSTVTENCVVAKGNYNTAWHDVTCGENSGVVCELGNNTAEGISGIAIVTTTAANDSFLQLSNTAKYALIAVCAACGLIIIILMIVLICLCCRRRHRSTPYHEDLARPRAYSQVSKIGVALPTPPGPPARHSLHESMYDTISLEEVHDQGPHTMNTFQRGLSGKSAKDGLNDLPNLRKNPGGPNGSQRKNYTEINPGAHMSLTYDTYIADNECYG